MDTPLPTAPIADEQAPAEDRVASGCPVDLRDERAATAIEYGLIAALIAVGILAALTLTGSSLAALYQYWSSAVVAAL